MANSTSDANVVSLELLQNAIRRKHGDDDISVTRYIVTPASQQGDNYVGIILSLEVTIQHDDTMKDLSLILKTTRRNSFMEKWLLQESNAFYKEVMFYKELIPDLMAYQGRMGLHHLGLSVPAYYYGDVDENKGILILENLQSQHYRMVDKQAGLDYEHCRVVMEELANFHAISWGFKNSSPDSLKQYTYLFCDSLYAKRESAFLQFSADSMSSFVKLVLCCSGDINVRTRVQKLLKINIYDSVTKPLIPIEPYALVCHGDAWNNNMLFKYNEDDRTPTGVKFLDFQAVRYAPPTTDLSYFFFTSTTRELRQNHLTDLLRIYHSSFINCLEKQNAQFPEFTFETLKQQYTDTAMFGFLSSCITLPLVVTNSEDSPEFREAKTEAELTQYNKEYFERFLETSRDNVIVKERMLGVVQDAIEMGLI